MRSTHTERVTWLEERIHELHPGWEETSTWNNKVWQNGCLYWAWRSELVRPKHVPKWVPILSKYNMKPIEWDKSRWRRYQEETWKKEYWSSLPPDSKIDLDIRFQMYYDPDLPSEDESIDMFRTLLASVPSLTIEWAEEYWDYWSERLGGPHITMDFDHDYEITHTALEFIMVKHKVKYWQTKLGKKNIDEIELPRWAIEAESRRNEPWAYIRKMEENHRAEFFPTRHERNVRWLRALDRLCETNGEDTELLELTNLCSS